MTESSYINIPSKLLLDSTIPSNAKILYGQIKSLTYKDGYCFATNKYLAQLNNLSIRTISSLISILTKKEYIKIHFKPKDNGMIIREIFITG